MIAVLQQIIQHKIVAIIRGASPPDVLKITRALYDGGIRLVEVTYNSLGALGLVKELSDVMGDKMLIGIGTILNAESAKKAINEGAKFIISPNCNIETIRVTKQMGVISIPGAYTATEIVTASSNGGDIIKIFPYRYFNQSIFLISKCYHKLL